MKKFLVIITGLLMTFNVFATEVTWETLKTLDFDMKTKKNIIKPELQKNLGKEVTIKGFMMPLDYDAKEVVEFLFMPYVPACMHVPPPPANQLILVKMKKGSKVKPSFYPIELSGKLAVEANADLESSFKMEGLKMKELKDSAPMIPPGQTP
ncbi:MAG: DUF3299 domain-containing protein [Rhizobacter sp.]|nr:DUF3299 domain-containing protein [Bacteriovorax sp.]